MSDLPEDLSSTLVAAARDVLLVEGVMQGDGDRDRVRPALRPEAQKEAEHADPLLVITRSRPRVRGRLLVPAEQAYRHLAEHLAPLGLTPVLRKGAKQNEAVVTALPGTIAQVRPNTRLALMLFLLTALSCLFVGAQSTEAAVASQTVNWRLLDGLPFAGSLLAILLSHEFGHYIVARRLGEPVSLPYFIPLPFSPLGTLGAVINMPAPPRNRRHLLAIGVAGPLAGFIVALPILWIGLHGSPVVQSLPQYSQEGNSLIYALFKFLTFGRFLPGGGQDVLVSQMAFAGWAGLLVTAFNLMPAGQLDGGHIVYALVGPRWSERILWVVLIGMALLSFLWIWWLLWVALSYLVSRLPQALLDDVTEITPSERILAVLALVVFVLVFIPIPFVAGQP